MLDDALAVASVAKTTMKAKLVEEKRQKRIQAHKKPHKQGWFKPRTGFSQKESSASSVTSAGSTDGQSVTSAHTAPAALTALRVPIAVGGNYSASGSVSGSLMRQSQSDEVITGRPTAVSIPHRMPRSDGDISHASSVAEVNRNMHSSSPPLEGSQNELVEALIDALDNDKMADVTLLGRDGVRVRATKYVLACQSLALQEKLYEGPTATEVFMGNYGEESIRTLKQYCQTGSLVQSPLVRHRSHDTARSLVELAALAKTYGFEALYRDADSILCQMIGASPWFATSAYDAASRETKLIEKFLVQFIKENCQDVLLETSALKQLCAKRLDKLLHALMGTGYARIFLYLQKWIDLKGATVENMEFAQDVASEELCLTSLLADPKMVPFVRSSGFFDLDEIDSIMQGRHTREDLTQEDPPEGLAEEEDCPSTLQSLPGAEHKPHRKKTYKRKKSKRNIEGLVYQLSPDGDVMLCSVENKNHFGHS